MRCIYFFLVNIFIFNTCPQAQQYLAWAHSGGSTGSDNANNTEVDAAGNVYSSGHFSGTIDADPSSGVFNLVSNGSNDLFLIKYSASGGFLWAISMGNSSYEGQCSVAIDPSGNPILSGTFSGTVDFDPGPGLLNLVSDFGSVFIVKLNASGQMIWANQTGDFNTQANDNVIDANGNIYIGGNTSNIGIVSRISNTGTLLWTKQFVPSPSSSSHTFCSSLTLDASGNVITTGLFNGTVDFNSGAGVQNFTAQGFYNGFLVKLDVAGNFVWAKQIATSTGISFGGSLVTDIAGNIYVCGRFEATTDFDPGTGVVNITANGFNDLFVTKYTPAGNLIWVKTLTGPDSETWGHICIDPSGMYISMAGGFSGLFDFDPGPGAFIIDGGPSGNGSGFICRLTNTGDFVWAGVFGGTGYPLCFSVSTDGCNNLYVSGLFSNIMDAEPGTNTNSLTSTGEADFFIIKLSQSLWTGNVSTDWHDPLNWDCNTVPGVQSNVIIPTLVPRYPVVFANAEIRSLTVLTAASLQVQPGVEMKVNGRSY